MFGEQTTISKSCRKPGHMLRWPCRARLLEVSLLVLVETIAVTGCDRADPRIARSIRDTSSYANGQPAAIARESEKEVIALLKEPTPASLRNPKVGAAWIERNPENNRIFLRLVWVEDKPSITGLELSSESQKWTRRFDFDPSIMDEIRKVSEVGVVYQYVIELTEIRDLPVNSAFQVMLSRNDERLGPPKRVAVEKHDTNNPIAN
jgi:hypothetical protein